MITMRKGSLVFFTFMAMFTVVGAIVGNVMFLYYIDTLSTETSSDSAEQYSSFVLREEILSADCATVRHGVFDMESVENGDLDCIGVPGEEFTVWFEWGDGVLDYQAVTYEIDSGDPSDVEERSGLSGLIDSVIEDLDPREEYVTTPARIYDSENDRYHKVILGYIGETDIEIDEDDADPDTETDTDDEETGEEEETDTDDETTGDEEDTGMGVTPSGNQTVDDAVGTVEDSDDTLVIDYDDLESPEHVYRQEENQLGEQHYFSDAVTYTGETALRMPLENEDIWEMGRSVYRFDDHDDGFGEAPRELYQSVQMYLPRNFEMDDGDTLRMLVNGQADGAGASGGGQPNGTNGWSVLTGISARDADDGTSRPDGEYAVFTYHYSMDHSGEVMRPAYFIEPGEWHQFESYVRVNSVSESGAVFDGVSRLWVNGELIHNREDMRWDTTGEQGIDHAGPIGYWFSVDGSWGPPVTTSLYYDDHRLGVEP